LRFARLWFIQNVPPNSDFFGGSVDVVIPHFYQSQLY